MSIAQIKPGRLKFGDAYFVAWKEREIRDRRVVTPKEIATAVAQEIGRREGYTAEAARGWRRGSKPDDYIVKVIAKVLGCDPALLLDADPGVQTLPRKPREVVHGRPRRRSANGR
jgi:hypothetical protein